MKSKTKIYDIKKGDKYTIQNEQVTGVNKIIEHTIITDSAFERLHEDWVNFIYILCKNLGIIWLINKLNSKLKNLTKGHK